MKYFVEFVIFCSRWITNRACPNWYSIAWSVIPIFALKSALVMKKIFLILFISFLLLEKNFLQFFNRETKMNRQTTQLIQSNILHELISLWGKTSSLHVQATHFSLKMQYPLAIILPFRLMSMLKFWEYLTLYH